MTRSTDAKQKRVDAADISSSRAHFGDGPLPIPNDQEQRFTNFIANYSKGLPHNSTTGEVDKPAYQSLLNALQTAYPTDFENITVSSGLKFKLTNSQSSYAFDLEGPDGYDIALLKKGVTYVKGDPSIYEPFPPPPTIDSLEGSSEMEEVYWMALARDVHFNDYNNSNIITKAIKSLSSYGNDFKGPRAKASNNIDHTTIFRGITDGDIIGPYVSQFMLKGNDDYVLSRKEIHGWVKYGTQSIDQRNVVAIKNKDYETSFKYWKQLQNGLGNMVDPLYKGERDPKDFFDDQPRFIRNLRDLATYVHFDALYQAYLTACLYLLRHADSPDATTSNVPIINEGNPYKGATKQIGFGTFGGPHILSLVCEVATRALKSVWFTKWLLFRRLRPEAFAGLVHLKKENSSINYPINNKILNSTVLNEVFNHNKNQNNEFDREEEDGQKVGTYLLPLAFLEGSPTHPSYGAGHATVAGACVTILKAWFNEKYPIKNPVVANNDGTKLIPYEGSDKDKLTLGGELNKLAANVSIARNAGGVHYRSDYTQSIRLGEAISIGILEEQNICYNERNKNGDKPFFKFTRFDGTPITIQ